MSYITKKGKNFEIRTPVSDLEWIMISGEGKLNKFNDNMEFTASVVIDPKSEQGKAFQEELDQFWADNKPKKAKKPASTSTYAHATKAAEPDEDGDPVYEEDGLLSIQMKTQTTWKDGKAKKITVFNAKGAEVQLGEKKIGNGSRGLLIGNICIYDNGGKVGISMYLNAVQLAKFVEYSGGVEAEALEEEDGFEGFDEELPEETGSEEGGAAKSTPRL